MNAEIGALDISNVEEGKEGPAEGADGITSKEGAPTSQIGVLTNDPSQAVISNRSSGKPIEKIDWAKVGKIYKPESAIEDILNKEVNRLSKGFEMQIDSMEAELEEKYKG